jgi:hypothetical protein
MMPFAVDKSIQRGEGTRTECEVRPALALSSSTATIKSSLVTHKYNRKRVNREMMGLIEKRKGLEKQG